MLICESSQIVLFISSWNFGSNNTVDLKGPLLPFLSEFNPYSFYPFLVLYFFFGYWSLYFSLIWILVVTAKVLMTSIFHLQGELSNVLICNLSHHLAVVESYS